MKKIVTIVGARPQFIKASVLRKLFADHPDFIEILVHTDQHYDRAMSEIFFTELDIKVPEYHLGINGGGQGDTTGRMLADIEKVLLKEKPDACLVYGDTNSTLAGALAAAKLHIPVIHVEAGLRSFNKSMPEEINRILTDHMSALLFCSTLAGVTNLRNENISNGVYHVGDIMFDATNNAKSLIRDMTAVQGINLHSDKLAVCTLHRAENTDDEFRLRSLIQYLNDMCKDYDVILPLHPRTKKMMEKFQINSGLIRMIEPVGYLEMQALLANSTIVFTDSGGLQKEAYFHQVPCVTLREETEWVELIENGWNRLWITELSNPKCKISEYGTGNCGKIILDKIYELI